jgi:hypothetical protein
MRYPPISPFGASEVSTLFNTTSPVQLVAVASNSNGMVLRRLVLEGAVTNTAVFVGAAAPASATAVNAFAIFALRTAGYNEAETLNLEIPAGYGCWVIADSGSASNLCYLSYDLL